MTAIRRFAFGGAVTAPTWIRSWRVALFAGRALLSVIFIISGIGKLFEWSQTVDALIAHGIPAAPVLLLGAILVEVFGGLSVLTGTYARFGALALALFLVPVTLLFHPFWNFTGPEQQLQMANFLKNVSIMGGLLLVTSVGAGAVSVDTRRQ